MSRDIDRRLEQYERRGQELQQAVRQVKRQQERQQQTSSFLKEGVARFIKDQYGVNKRHSRPVLDILEQGGTQQDQMQALEMEFKQWLQDLKQFVGTISEETKTDSQNSEKLLRKFNRVERKVKLETKLKHALTVVRELKNLPLVYNKELKQRERKVQQSQSEPASTQEDDSPRHPVADLTLDEIIDRGETNAIEFKREIPGSKRNIAEELVALSTQKGGVLVIGVSDEGKVTGLDDPNQVEEQVANIVRATIDPPMNPDIKKRTVNSEDVVVVEVSRFQDTPYNVNGTFYRRVGTTKQKLSSSEAKDLFS